MSGQPLIKCSVNRSVVNKTDDFSTEPSTWTLFEGSPEQLLQEVIFKGHALNQSLFPDGRTRSGTNADGGNLIVLDLDDGLLYEKILASPTYQQYGCFVYPSASCGVVAEKQKVDGRERWRVGFLLERDVKTDRWTEDDGELRINKQRQHLERIACAKHLANNFCSDVGIPKLLDNCHSSVSQPFFGNDGETPIPFDFALPDGSTEKRTYPCSVEKRFHINGGYLPAADMDRLIEVHKDRNAEVFEERKARPADDVAREFQITQWLFENDVFTDEQLKDRDISVKQLMAYARSFEDALFDSYMWMMERVMDGHDWRQPHELERAWYSYHVTSSFSFGTIHFLAEQADPDWRSKCPYMSGGYRKYPVPPLSEAFSLLRSTNPTNIII